MTYDQEPDALETEESGIHEDTESKDAAESSDPPTVPIPTMDGYVRYIADGFKLAFEELRPRIIEMLVEAQRTMDTQLEGEREPDIDYNERRHVFKVIAELSGFVVAYALLTIAYVLFAGNLGAALLGVLTISVIIMLGVRFINNRQARIEDDVERNQYKRWSRLTLVLLSFALCALFVVVAESVGVNAYWSGAYVVMSVILLYFSLRLYYIWAKLRIVRDGDMLRAERPEKGIFFLPTLKRKLYLRNVNNTDTAQTWLEEKLGMYRILIRLDAEMPDPNGTAEDKEAYRNAMFWTNLKYIVKGNQLSDSIEQGSRHRRE